MSISLHTPTAALDVPAADAAVLAAELARIADRGARRGATSASLILRLAVNALPARRPVDLRPFELEAIREALANLQMNQGLPESLVKLNQDLQAN